MNLLSKIVPKKTSYNRLPGTIGGDPGVAKIKIAGVRKPPERMKIDATTTVLEPIGQETISL